LTHASVTAVLRERANRGAGKRRSIRRSLARRRPQAIIRRHSALHSTLTELAQQCGVDRSDSEKPMRIATLAKFATFLALGLSLAAAASQPVAAASAVEIDAEVDAALIRFYEEVPAARDFAKKARGVLIFPKVVKAGFGVGGEYGEGALRSGGRSVAYYNTAAASIGLQIGVQSRAEVLMFMTQEALDRFQSSDGWEVGVDGSVTVVKTGVAGEIDTNTISDPVIGFVFGEQGLMANLSLEGAKFTRLDKS
jgi:lipid-binding SYLF domain-containing protein